MFVSVDQPVTDASIQRLCTIDGMADARLVHLPTGQA
jgi:hypothetical protein